MVKVSCLQILSDVFNVFCLVHCDINKYDVKIMSICQVLINEQNEQ